MEAKKRAAKTTRNSLFNIQRPNQTLQRDSSPPLFHFLTGYFLWSDLDSQNLIFVFHFQPNRNMKAKQREGRGKNNREKENWQNLFIHHPYTFTIHTKTWHQHSYTKPSKFHPHHTLAHFTIFTNKENWPISQPQRRMQRAQWELFLLWNRFAPAICVAVVEFRCKGSRGKWHEGSRGCEHDFFFFFF